MQGDRVQMLGRIREALTISAPLHHEAPAVSRTGSGSEPYREWLPAGGTTFADQLAVFARQSEVLRTELHPCSDEAEAVAQLMTLAAAGGWKRLAYHGGDITEGVVARLSSLELLNTDRGYEKSALESCDAALTECESLIAQTGSVCVTSRSSGGRALSVLPPHHIVVARRGQMLPDLTAAFELLARRYGQDYPSFISFISGPSRTGDIERILVLGAHGPKRLTILLLP